MRSQINLVRNVAFLSVAKNLQLLDVNISYNIPSWRKKNPNQDLNQGCLDWSR